MVQDQHSPLTPHKPGLISKAHPSTGKTNKIRGQGARRMESANHANSHIKLSTSEVRKLESRGGLTLPHLHGDD